MVIHGMMGFLKTASLILIVLELSLILEEYFRVRLEVRKGFTGAQTTILKIFTRHLLQILRTEGGFKQHLSVGIRALSLMIAAGFLPGWNGEPSIVSDHSLWLFLGLGIAAPAMTIVFQWIFRNGAGWPFVLSAAERALGSASVLFILGIALVGMTGMDTFVDLRNQQNAQGWLIFNFPLAAMLMFAFIVVGLFTSFQTIFGRRQKWDKQSGWSFDDVYPHLNRAIWSVFTIDVFVGGAPHLGVVGDALFVAKCVALNVGANVLSQLLFGLREDQAEDFMLWKLVPASVLILALSLIFPGSHT